VSGAPTEISRHREKLSAAIADCRNAGTSGINYVLQRPDGAVVSARTSWWTYDIGEAYAASEFSHGHLGSTPVPTETARSYLINIMQAELDILNGNL